MDIMQPSLFNKTDFPLIVPGRQRTGDHWLDNEDLTVTNNKNETTPYDGPIESYFDLLDLQNKNNTDNNQTGSNNETEDTVEGDNNNSNKESGASGSVVMWAILAAACILAVTVCAVVIATRKARAHQGMLGISQTVWGTMFMLE